MAVPTARSFGGKVAFPVSREVAFDYLVDPRHRAQWQASLAGVSGVTGEPRRGQTWTDRTKPGLQPRMETTEFDRPTHWSESGTWRFVRADLSLDFTESPDAGPATCVVSFRFRIHALGPIGLAVSLVSLPAVASDLRRAARILGDQAD